MSNSRCESVNVDRPLRSNSRLNPRIVEKIQAKMICCKESKPSLGSKTTNHTYTFSLVPFLSEHFAEKDAPISVFRLSALSLTVPIAIPDVNTYTTHVICHKILWMYCIKYFKRLWRRSDSTPPAKNLPIILGKEVVAASRRWRIPLRFDGLTAFDFSVAIQSEICLRSSSRPT